jgi:hypothetical protein
VSVREGKWRCTYCSVVNRGAELACTGCGATREKDVSFFVEDDAEEVQDAALLKRAEAGADWLCTFCQTSNRPEATHCTNCGAERGSAPSRPVEDVPAPTPVPPASPTSLRPAPASGRRTGCAILAVVLLFLATGFCAASYFLFFRKTETRAQVTGFEWDRAIAVEVQKSVRERAWEGAVPSGAREVSRQREIHHTDKVPAGTQKVKVGTKNLGNGFFKDVYEDRPVFKDQPVYRNRITYDVERWTKQRTADAQGRDQVPEWPDPRLGSGERAGERTERYTVILVHQGVTDRLDLPLDRWKALRPGQNVTAVLQGTGRLTDIVP